MIKKMLAIFLLAILPVVLFAGTTGKLAGVVRDKETGEPLAGANVQVIGTYLGTATDADGNFMLLNVPVGQLDVKVSYMGYSDIVNEDVRVSVDLTTDIVIDMVAAAVEGETVYITAERPLVNPNVTNESHVITAEDIANMPIRSYAGVIATNTGVVSAGGDMYVRGGRSNEIAYYIDGVYNNDLRTGDRVGDIPINSIEELNYQAGGFNAEYGFANSGIVIASSKGGSKEYTLTGEVITDEFLSRKDKVLGTYSYGYNVYNLTASGPIPYTNDKLSFIVSAEKTYRYDRGPSSGTHPELDGNFTNEEIWMTRDDLISERIPESDWILPVKNVEGPLPYNSTDQWALNGNVVIDLNPIRIKLGGNGTVSNWRDYNQFITFVDGARAYDRDNFNYSGYLKVTHTLSPNTFYDATAYYSAFGNEISDPILGRNLGDYGDLTDWNNNGLYNAVLPQDGLVNQSIIRLGSGIYNPPENPMTQYDMNRSNVLGAKLDFTHQIGRTHELKTGFEYRYNTMRRYALTRAWQLAGVYSNNPSVDPNDAYRQAYTENFGYPVYFDNDKVDPSNTLDDGLDGAKHPIIGAVYLQDKIELADLVLNLGVRADYIDANDKRPEDPYNVKIKDGGIDPDQLIDTESHVNISPRLGVSFPVTDKTVFHAQFGRFVQQPELQYLYTGWDYYAGQLLQGNMVDIGNPDLEPIKTTSYEVGIGKQLTMNSSLSITAFYKEITNNIVLKNRYGARPVTYAQYQNGDYGNVKGISLTYKLRRVEHLSGNINYTLQWASGTGSTSDGNFYVAWIGREYYPVFVSPLDFDQRHTLSANIDFRTYPDDGPELFGYHVLGNMVLNFLVEAGSGFPYTPKRIADTVFQNRASTAYPIAAVNSSYTDWTYNLDLRLDKKFSINRVDMDLYFWVINVLGTKQPFARKNNRESYTTGIYETTGRPDDNGWLNTNEGQRWIESNYGARAEEMYRSYINFPENWEAPRQIRLGLRVSL